MVRNTYNGKHPKRAKAARKSQRQLKTIATPSSTRPRYARLAVARTRPAMPNQAVSTVYFLRFLRLGCWRWNP